jgi:hypothetical protein
MQKALMVRTTRQGERFVYRELWRVVVRQLQHANLHKRGAFYDHLVAMVFAFHTVEAYVNFLGERLQPGIWARKPRRPYTTFERKLDDLMKLLNVPKSNRPANLVDAIWDLKLLRDLIAHGKSESILRTIEHTSDEEPPMEESFLQSQVTAKRAAKSAQDAKRFIEWLHGVARTTMPGDVWLRADALRGVLQQYSSHTALAT